MRLTRQAMDDERQQDHHRICFSSCSPWYCSALLFSALTFVVMFLVLCLLRSDEDASCADLPAIVLCSPGCRCCLLGGRGRRDFLLLHMEGCWDLVLHAADEGGATLGDHHGWGGGLSTWDGADDRRITDPDILHADDLKRWRDDGIVASAHPARSNTCIGAVHSVLGIFVDFGIALDVDSWVDLFAEVLLPAHVLSKLSCELHSLGQGSDVGRVIEVTHVDGRLHVGVGRVDADLAS
mmetsp:Transcript_4504/g.11835  ORF Transcript_4504/g.11835 Transcript_4504/m.11835 type:complete len:238 (-) Transcript_4504:271-984(-)